ncbi:uncharacterized protein RCC_06820 [Ramularia collo-cygni]|uniref:Uncharacterized protein n=1 Tax=Ramularia collo-cygni TaxID=112498 RepID=A0A2D3VGF0_9PEZI|nr:uncharacterized protein RCC_06820 [Ramularia collo-cygni]CZT20959.1 uncharacterized protein RCC_06820 [Ramularia collo-cygni]
MCLSNVRRPSLLLHRFLFFFSAWHGLAVLQTRHMESNIDFFYRPSNIPAPGRGGNSTGNLTSQLNPKLINLRILNTTASTLHLELTLNITNPTPYSAWIPYVDIHLSKNGSLLGHATAQNMSITPGRNSGLVVTANWEPKKKDAKTGAEIGRELISQYISSYANLTLGVGMHEESFPSNPILGRGLKKFEMQVPLPKLGDDMPPDDGDGDDDGDESPHFMKDAHMHLLSSTATFLLLSPLKSEILWIETLNATAFYEDEPAGGIFYEEPMGVLPLSWTEGGAGWETPRLPVRWKAGSVGFEAVKKALGGQLRLGAYAEVGVRIGRWREEVWFRGGRLGVRIGL